MGAPIIHIEFRTSDFGRTAAFYSKVFDWQTQQNASSTYMKHDAEEGPSEGWTRADLSQAHGPLAFVAVDDLAGKLAEIEKAGGRVIVPRLPFAGGGEVGLFADPDGNVMALWMRKERAAGTAAAPSAAAAVKPATAKATAKPAAAPKAAKPADKKPKKR